MLDVAQKYKDQLNTLFYDIWYDLRYKYWNYGTYSDEYSPSNSNYDRRDFVSIHENEIIGYISYTIRRGVDIVDSLGILNFKLDDPHASLLFGYDLRTALTDIFEKWNFRKITFTVVIGNPVEPKYTRLVKHLGGRIVGLYKEDTKLMDNTICDVQMYEILRSDYMKRRKKDGTIQTLPLQT